MATVADGELFETYPDTFSFPPKFVHTGFPRPVVLNMQPDELAPCDFGMGKVHRIVKRGKDVNGRYFVVYDVVFFGGVLIRTWIGE